MIGQKIAEISSPKHHEIVNGCSSPETSEALERQPRVLLDT